MASETSPIPAQPEAAAIRLGRQLRKAREAAGLKLKVVATRAETSETTLSLLERGQRAVPADLLERIVRIIGADGAEAFRLADLVPPQAAAEVLGAEVAGALSPNGLTQAGRQALRRVHLEVLASRATVGVLRPPVSLEQLLDTQFGIEVRPVSGTPWGRFAGSELVEYAAGLDVDGERAARNLVLGHMAGHAVIASEVGRRPACNHAAGGALEAEATWVAGLLLLPREMLESEAQVLAGAYNVSDRQGLANFAAEVADAFAVPDWLALAHLADSGVLAWAAGQEGV